MPYCEPCQKYHAPSAMGSDGTCPICGQPIDVETDRSAGESTPWHFKLLIAAVIIYLGWRFIQLFGYL